jgi:hypothetical protein
MALNIITWLWGDKYGTKDVSRLANAAANYLRCDHRFYLFSDRRHFGLPSHIRVSAISDPNLCARHCFCRLRMFDPIWQGWHGMDGKIISLDLDVIITGEIDYLFAGDESFKILKGANASNPNPFNASIMMLQGGAHADVWADFDIDHAGAIPYHEFPDDQGWINYKLPGAAGWQVGAASGIYAFKKPGWPSGQGDELPDDARIVTFIGSRKPQQFEYLPWIRKYWTAAA